jgi:hypothetical protein
VGGEIARHQFRNLVLETFSILVRERQVVRIAANAKRVIGRRWFGFAERRNERNR